MQSLDWNPSRQLAHSFNLITRCANKSPDRSRAQQRKETRIRFTSAAWPALSPYLFYISEVSSSPSSASDPSFCLGRSLSYARSTGIDRASNKHTQTVQRLYHCLSYIVKVLVLPFSPSVHPPSTVLSVWRWRGHGKTKSPSNTARFLLWPPSQISNVYPGVVGCGGKRGPAGRPARRSNVFPLLSRHVSSSFRVAGQGGKKGRTS